MSVVGDFVSKNWKWLGTAILYMAFAYAQYESMKNDVATNKRRLQNYIERNRQQEKVIHDLELRIVILETTE